MKVLFVHNSLAEYRLDFWRRLGNLVDMTILVMQPGTDAKIYGLEKDSTQLTVMYFSGMKKLKEILSQGFERVILPPSDSVGLYAQARFIQRYCLRNAIPVYYWTEKWEPPKDAQPLGRKIKNAVLRYMIYTLCKQCTRCISAGSKSKDYLISMGIPKEKISVAIDASTSPMGKNDIDVRMTYSIPPDAKVILFLGRILERKGIMELLQAFERLSATDDAVWLLVAGDGALRPQCEQFVCQHNIPRCIFAGKVQPATRRSFFTAADVFCLPSNIDRGRVDIWGLTVNEALECGTPVIATTGVGAAYDVLDKETGAMVLANSVDALYVALRNWTKQKKSSEIEAACKRQYARFNTEQMAVNFYKALEQAE